MKTNTHKSSSPAFYRRCELDSFADTIVVAKNCIVLEYLYEECGVSLYIKDYAAIKNVP